MICPKCRKRYTDDIKCCPDCGFELVSVMGDIDIPEKSVYDSRDDIPVQNTDNDGFLPVIYKAKEDDTTPKKRNALAITFLVIGILMIIACILVIFKDKISQVISGDITYSIKDVVNLVSFYVAK